MIAPPKPGSDLWRVLATVAANDGELDARAVAGVLWPYKAAADVVPPKWSPTGASAAWAAWRASVQGRQLAEERHWRERTAEAATLLQRLTSIGLLIPARSCLPELSAWYRGMGAEVGEEAALRRALWAGVVPEDEDDDDDPRKGADLTWMLAMIQAISAGIKSTSDLLGAGAGGVRRDYGLLIEAGVIVPPTYRRVTAKGREFLVSNKGGGG